MKNTARNKQIVFFAESTKTVKLKLFLEKAKKGHSGEFLDIQLVDTEKYLFYSRINWLSHTFNRSTVFSEPNPYSATRQYGESNAVRVLQSDNSKKLMVSENFSRLN